jgi:hypothetical protein
MRFKLIQISLSLALCVLCGASVAYGQAVRGSLVGTVTDASGAAAIGATVVAIESRTNISSTATTNGDGNYAFSSIQDGLYRVEVTLSGFKKVIQENVTVSVNTTVRADFTMQVGEVSEAVTSRGSWNRCSRRIAPTPAA